MFGVRLDAIVECDRTIRRSIDVGRERERSIRRSDGAAHEAVTTAAFGCREIPVDRRAQLLGGLKVQPIGDMLELVVGLCDRRRRERVRFAEMRAGLQIRHVDRANDVGPRQREQIVVALEILRVRCKLCATKVGFRQRKLLNRRAHCTIDDKNLYDIKNRTIDTMRQKKKKKEMRAAHET